MNEKQIEHYKNLKRLHIAQGNLNYGVEVFGDFIASREGYDGLSGIDAVHFYLVTKYHWLPSQVKSMSEADLRFVLHQEMQGWTLPKEARV